jgi:hypothetical protein
VLQQQPFVPAVAAAGAAATPRRPPGRLLLILLRLLLLLGWLHGLRQAVALLHTSRHLLILLLPVCCTRHQRRVHVRRGGCRQ